MPNQRLFFCIKNKYKSTELPWQKKVFCINGISANHITSFPYSLSSVTSFLHLSHSGYIYSLHEHFINMQQLLRLQATSVNENVNCILLWRADTIISFNHLKIQSLYMIKQSTIINNIWFKTILNNTYFISYYIKECC